ncbi:amidohydrolase family protein [Pseudodesulfovibrio sediminis]|uniref:Amidohydrolase-related domain-containing protein n=1 Tax=Pseudodesulfovibrio sediminis TaxID=2810563 RepID=A0ABM7P5M8_9BACT|nr:amidohydrolase family protein [Pseudodesulfovibrio sediminis]BCS88901.1 hypothetical protein PSDVSF_21430 [Pseudodesulfovibrio sediminis]
MPLSRRDFLASMVGLGTLLCPCTGTTGPLPKGTFALTGTVITGTGQHPLKNGTVLVNKGIIEAVLPEAHITDRPVIALPDAAILPGIINAHCHRIHTREERRDRWLAKGVTSIGDVGSTLDDMRLLAQSPTGTTATAAFCGPMIAPSGGYPTPIHKPVYALVADTPKQGRETVRQLEGQGATMIKISFEPGIMPRPWPMFDADTAEAICTEARRLGLIIRCHVEDFAGLKPALDAGVNTVEHVPYRWHEKGVIRQIFNDNGELIPSYIAMLERMVRENIILTPTLDVLNRTPWKGPALFEPVRTFNAMGGRMALGNDFPYRRTDAGMPLEEMRLLACAGLSSSQIIQAATRTSAAACNLSTRGTLAPGMAADILVTAANPDTTMTTLEAPRHIIKDGIFIN